MIDGELAAYSAALAGAAPDRRGQQGGPARTRRRRERLEQFCAAKGLTLFVISAVTGIGLPSRSRPSPRGPRKPVAAGGHERRAQPGVRRLVVKVGSGLVTARRRGARPHRARSPPISPSIREGREVVLVTSGAIATGRRAGAARAAALHSREAGGGGGGPVRLMWHYEPAFGRHSVQVGQVLLTGAGHQRPAPGTSTPGTRCWRCSTFDVLPIVNENDTVAVEEIKVGDNDNLSALVASLIDADLLVLLTDVDGLYTGDPTVNASAGRSRRWRRSRTRSRASAHDRADRMSVGGMATKLQAARKAAASGMPMIIAGGREPGVLRRHPRRRAGRDLLRAEGRPPRRAEALDRIRGAATGLAHGRRGRPDGLTQRGKSLLPSGIVEVEGTSPRARWWPCEGAPAARSSRGASSTSTRRSSARSGARRRRRSSSGWGTRASTK